MTARGYDYIGDYKVLYSEMGPNDWIGNVFYKDEPAPRTTVKGASKSVVYAEALKFVQQDQPNAP